MPFHGVLIDAADRAADTQTLFLIAELDILVALAAANVLHQIALIDGPIGVLLQVIACLHRNLLTLYRRSMLNIHFEHSTYFVGFIAD
jgi:hypothetical protein